MKSRNFIKCNMFLTFFCFIFFVGCHSYEDESVSHSQGLESKDKSSVQTSIHTKKSDLQVFIEKKCKISFYNNIGAIDFGGVEFKVTELDRINTNHFLKVYKESDFPTLIDDLAKLNAFLSDNIGNPAYVVVPVGVENLATHSEFANSDLQKKRI